MLWLSVQESNVHNVGIVLSPFYFLWKFAQCMVGLFSLLRKHLNDLIQPVHRCVSIMLVTHDGSHIANWFKVSKHAYLQSVVSIRTLIVVVIATSFFDGINWIDYVERIKQKKSGFTFASLSLLSFWTWKTTFKGYMNTSNLSKCLFSPINCLLYSLNRNCSSKYVSISLTKLLIQFNVACRYDLSSRNCDACLLWNGISIPT